MIGRLNQPGTLHPNARARGARSGPARRLGRPRRLLGVGAEHARGVWHCVHVRGRAEPLPSLGLMLHVTQGSGDTSLKKENQSLIIYSNWDQTSTRVDPLAQPNTDAVFRL